MVILVNRKFGQNENLRKILIATGDAELINASHTDSKWGAGKGMRQIIAGEKFHGKNFFGKNFFESQKHLIFR